MTAMALSHKGPTVILAQVTEFEVHLEQRHRHEAPALAIGTGDAKILLAIGEGVDPAVVCDRLVETIGQWRRDLTGERRQVDAGSR